MNYVITELKIFLSTLVNFPCTFYSIWRILFSIIFSPWFLGLEDVMGRRIRIIHKKATGDPLFEDLIYVNSFQKYQRLAKIGHIYKW